MQRSTFSEIIDKQTFIFIM